MKIRVTFIILLYAILMNAQISEKVKELAKPLDTVSYAESSHVGVGR
ncbi:hypothetical protein HNP38_001392 [Chryseobacterium defluvii]|uniref:Uncharacterized protein n=1 Tax=Chryseobacterium defluvii TaxID=160396 RepID=A0A840KF19_9FLAO|nr:hypothetical protein [Chryseobacterium defluvii]